MKLKKYIALSLMVFILFLSVPAHALYRVTDFTGGCAYCLDVIDGARLTAKTKPAYTIVTTTPEHATYPDKEFTYLWDSDAACSESVPDSIIPDTNASGGCWILLTPGQAADIVDDSVKDVSIDWGTGSEQVSAVDVPIADTGALITGTEVETALQENRGLIDTNTAASHAESHAVASHSDTLGTGAELDTLTDTSDASGLHNHTTANLNDTTATGAELTELTDGSVTTEHDHSRVAASDGTPNDAIDCDSDGDCTASGNATVGGDLTATGTGTFESLTVNETGIFNELDLVSEGDFATVTKWSEVGDFNITGGTAAYAHSTGTGTLTQLSTDMVSPAKGAYSCRVRYDVSNAAGDPTAILYSTGGIVDTDVTLGVSSNDTGLITRFTTGASPTDLKIKGDSDSGDDTFTLDNIEIYCNPVKVIGGLQLTDRLTFNDRLVYRRDGISHGMITAAGFDDAVAYLGWTGSHTDLFGFAQGDDTGIEIRGAIGSIDPNDDTPANIIGGWKLCVTGCAGGQVDYVQDLDSLETILDIQNAHTSKARVRGNGNIESVGSLYLGSGLDSQFIPNFNANIGLRITPGAGATFDLSLGSNTDNNLITTKGKVIGLGTEATDYSVEVMNGNANGIGVKLGVPLNAFSTYLHVDTLDNDEDGATGLEATHCDADAEVGRMIMSSRYSATAEYRLWICTKTGASAYTWKYTVLN